MAARLAHGYCRDRDAPLTGADVVRIATALEVAPATFAAAAPVAPGDHAPDTFPTPDGARARLVLARRTEPDGGTACVFLLALGSGRRHCGLGALAPTACRLHPATGPGPRSLPLTADEITPVHAALARQLADERAVWEAFLAEVAARVAQRPGPLDLETLLDAQLAAAAT